ETGERGGDRDRADGDGDRIPGDQDPRGALRDREVGGDLREQSDDDELGDADAEARECEGEQTYGHRFLFPGCLGSRSVVVGSLGVAAAQSPARPLAADVTRSLLPRVCSVCTAVVQVSVSVTAAQLEWSRAMRVSWTCWAGARPASLTRSIAPVASERTSTARPRSSAAAAEARTQLLVMYPTRVTV